MCSGLFLQCAMYNLGNFPRRQDGYSYEGRVLFMHEKQQQDRTRTPTARRSSLKIHFFILFFSEKLFHGKLLRICFRLILNLILHFHF